MTGNQNSFQQEAVGESPLMDGIHYTGNKGPWFGARIAMIILVSLGSGLLLVMSMTFTVVLVAMTTSNTSSNANIPTYDWSNKGVIFSSSIWLGIPIQLIAGPLGKKYGHKWLILGAYLISTLFYMLIPTFAKLGGSTGLMFCRIIGGGASGMIGPLVVSVSGLWVPAEERSKAGMVSAVFSFLSATISSITAGQIVASSIGYPGCCYIFGGVCLIWCLLWTFFAHQSPATHPRITPEERKYIETSLNSKKTEHLTVPWLKLLTSLNFWAPVVAGVGTAWIDTMMSSVNLIFITTAWKINIAKSTSTMGIAPIAGLVVACALAPLSDFLVKKKFLRLVNARRIYHSVGTIGNAICMLWMTLIPVGASMALVVLNLSLNTIFIMTYSVGGAALNVLDISPAFAGIISGFASTFSQCFALFAPMTIDWMVKDEEDFSEWRMVFFITAIIVLVTTIFFDLFATDKRQWDNEKEEVVINDPERVNIQEE